MSLKRAIQAVVRTAHATLWNRGLPDQLGLYLHEVPPSHTARLAAMLAELRRRGYSLGLPDAHMPGQGKTAVITFDDNFSNWTEILPTLAEHSVRAIFYVNSLPSSTVDEGQLAEYCSRIGYQPHRYPGALTEAQLHQLVQSGHRLGNHTHSHLRLTECSPQQALADIQRCQRFLRRFGPGTEDFAVPYGMRRFLPEETAAAIRQADFRIALGTPGLLHRPAPSGCWHRSPWNLERGLQYNLTNLAVDGYWFERLTGRAAVS